MTGQRASSSDPQFVVGKGFCKKHLNNVTLFTVLQEYSCFSSVRSLKSLCPFEKPMKAKDSHCPRHYTYTVYKQIPGSASIEAYLILKSTHSLPTESRVLARQFYFLFSDAFLPDGHSGQQSWEWNS